MTLTLSDIKHIQVMEALAERQLPAAEEKKTSLKEKLILLSGKLRSKGFDKQAEELENAALDYRHPDPQLEALYHTDSETGDELLAAAHPDGDVEVAPATDHQGDVETKPSAHKKILDAISDDRKSNVLAMLRESLGMKVLADATDTINGFEGGVKEEVATPDQKKEQQEFDAVADEVIDIIGRMVYGLSIAPYNKISFDGGWSLTQYYTRAQSLIEKLKMEKTNYLSLKAAKKPPTAALDLLNMCSALTKTIDDAVLGGKVLSDGQPMTGNPFDAGYSAKLSSLAEALKHRWYNFWQQYGGMYGAAKGDFHKQFLTPGIISDLLNKQSAKITQVNDFIDILLAQKEIMAAPEVSNYLKGMKSFTDKVKGSFTTAITESEAFISGKSAFMSKDVSFTTADLAKFFKDASVSKYLNFTGIDAFKKSISDLTSSLFTKLRNLIDNNTVFDDTRDKFVSGLETRIKRIEQL